MKDQELGVIVLDPFRDPRWSADFITRDPNEFLEVFWRSRSCHCFIDEAGDTVGRYDEAMRRTATAGRQWGHSCYYLAQRATLVSVTVRGQCRHLYLFCLSTDDAILLAKEWNEPLLKEASKLKEGEYFHCQRFRPTTRGNLFSTEAIRNDEPNPEGVPNSGSSGGGSGTPVHGNAPTQTEGTDEDTGSNTGTYTGTNKGTNQGTNHSGGNT